LHSTADHLVSHESTRNAMTENILVSIVTATYNMGRFIEEAIESVLTQTYGKFQYIIVDDGSTDDTRTRVKKYLTDPRVEYHYQDNQGCWAARNVGLKLSQGAYICFLDADNKWNNDKLEKQLQAFKTLAPDYKIVYTDQVWIDADGAIIGRPVSNVYSGQISEKLLFENFVHFNTAMVRAECFDEMGYFDDSLTRSGDYEAWLRLSTRYLFHYLPYVTVLYRMWEGQISQDQEKRLDTVLKLLSQFIHDNARMLDKKVVKKAWGYALAIRGQYWVSRRQYRRALKFFFRALKYDALSTYTWRSMIHMGVPPRLLTACYRIRRKLPMRHESQRQHKYCPPRKPSDMTHRDCATISETRRTQKATIYRND
jgi:glycosyltransferase involved in cell wall biosynthesis